MNYFYTFNLKEPKAKKPSLIYLRVSFPDRNNLKYSTGEKINPKYWDFDTQFPKKISGRSTEAVQINSVIMQLTRYIEEYQLICTRLESQDIALTASRIKQELDYVFKKSAQLPSSFFSVFDQFIQEKIDLGQITEGTINRYKNIKAVLEDFSKSCRYKLTFDSIDENFYTKFVKYSRTNLKHKDNTLGRNIGFIKTFMNWAALKKYHYNLHYKQFKKISSATDEIALSLDEINTLYEFDFSKNSRLEKVRDVFIFGCATGMRYSDYSRISKENIRNGEIFINVKKTKNSLGIPLNKFSREILEKYNYSLPSISEQKFRDYIKEACKIAGFVEDTTKTTFRGKERIEEVLPKYERISTHTARRSFITISLEGGMNIETIMSITGHKSYSSFQKYIKLSQSAREKEMSKVWN